MSAVPSGGSGHGALSGHGKDGNLIPDIAGALTDGGHGGGGLNGQDVYANRIIPTYCPDVANPLTRRMRKGFNTTLDEGHTPIVSFNWQNGAGYGEAHDGLGVGIDHAGPQSVSQVQAIAIRTANTGANGHGVADEVAHTIDGAQGQAVAFKPSYYTRGKDGAPSDIVPPLSADADKGDQEPVIAFKPGQSADSHSIGAQDDIACTLEGGEGGNNRQAIAFAENQRGELIESDQAYALQTSGGKPGQGYPAVHTGMQVRRLTPLECERLQGFSDGYTKIPKCSDSGRYRALGNSMAVPVMAWIGRRIQEVDDGCG